MADLIDMEIPVVLASAESNPDVCSGILCKQGMELADEDDNYIRIHSAYQAGRRAMFQDIIMIFSIALMHSLTQKM